MQGSVGDFVGIRQYTHWICGTCVESQLPSPGGGGACSNLNSPFENVGLICQPAVGKAAMQKPTDYKEIISPNPSLVFHCPHHRPLMSLFPACSSSPVSLSFISSSSPQCVAFQFPPSKRQAFLLCKNLPILTCCTMPGSQ